MRLLLGQVLVTRMATWIWKEGGEIEQCTCGLRWLASHRPCRWRLDSYLDSGPSTMLGLLDLGFKDRLEEKGRRLGVGAEKKKRGSGGRGRAEER